MWQFAKAVEGIGAACRALDVPITGGNVSLYNETDGKAIYPTPTIGVVGLLEHADRVVSRRFQESGDAIVLLGDGPRRARRQRVPEGRCMIWCAACRRRSISSAERALQALLVTLAGRAAGAVGARLLRRRPRGDRWPSAASTPPASARDVDRRVTRVARRSTRRTSPRRCSASRRRAWSCRSCPRNVTTVLRARGGAQACRRGSSARPAATGCGSRWPATS